MSVNWSARDLMNRLRSEVVAAKRIRVGDIVCGEHSPEHVARIDIIDGRYFFYDEYNNGTGGYTSDREIRIVDRDSLKEQPA